jgi:hypothetical protein
VTAGCAMRTPDSQDAHGESPVQKSSGCSACPQHDNHVPQPAAVIAARHQPIQPGTGPQRGRAQHCVHDTNQRSRHLVPPAVAAATWSVSAAVSPPDAGCAHGRQGCQVEMGGGRDCGHSNPKHSHNCQRDPQPDSQISGGGHVKPMNEGQRRRAWENGSWQHPAQGRSGMAESLPPCSAQSGPALHKRAGIDGPTCRACDAAGAGG